MAECINSFDIPVKDGFDKKKLGWQHPYLRTSGLKLESIIAGLS
jgi:hypothetical protein